MDSHIRTLIFILQNFSPAKVIFAGVGILLSVRSSIPLFACARAICNLPCVPQEAKNAPSSQETLIDIFEHIENFFRRLEVYIEVPPTSEMTGMMVKIMVEVLSILGIATKEIKQGRLSE